jgi:hypothetical protein
MHCRWFLGQASRRVFLESAAAPRSYRVQTHKQTCVCPHGEEVHAGKWKLHAPTQDAALIATSISLLSALVIVINSIRPLHTTIKTRCVRVCGRNAGYEMTCFSSTHINYFTSRSFVCVSRRSHITQERGTQHSSFLLLLPDKHTHETSFHLLIWSSYCVLH